MEFTGMVIWFKFFEFATSTQCLPSPAFELLVCACKRHPVWSDGHDKVQIAASQNHGALGRHRRNGTRKNLCRSDALTYCIGRFHQVKIIYAIAQAHIRIIGFCYRGHQQVGTAIRNGTVNLITIGTG